MGDVVGKLCDITVPCTGMCPLDWWMLIGDGVHASSSCSFSNLPRMGMCVEGYRLGFETAAICRGWLVGYRLYDGS